ncbi:alpha/beta-hydrolase [Podospora aff. communis PSN243]|uniref:Alpha/beta-hydrolase n=1 Tax=Podospora aff. communis PSN243 TaxID=3040156 RepID=A0AAV9G824_9PEZI|nr:alpha/beta-hydrolase [Podospora aff. communis PSN243]
MSTTSYIVGPTKGFPHTHTVILLHGRDSDACEFASEFFECEASGTAADRTLTALFPTIRWVFPQARSLRSERFDVDMSQWFDMWSLEDVQERSELQAPGLRSSVDVVIETIEDEELIVPRQRIVLGGISQGFATSLAALFGDGKGGFAGLCGFCSWMPLATEIASFLRHNLDPSDRLVSMQRLYAGKLENGRQSAVLDQQLQTTPILLEHNQNDPVIAIENGKGMWDALGELGFRHVEWHEYEDGEHWINEPQGVDDFVNFLRRAVGI